MANAIDQLTDRVLVLGAFHRPPRYYRCGGHHFCRSPDISDPGVHSARRLASERPYGVAVLLDRVTSLGGVHIDISLGMLALNIPVALLCWSGISKRFVIFSMMQVVLSSLFLNVFHFAPFWATRSCSSFLAAWSRVWALPSR